MGFRDFVKIAAVILAGLVLLVYLDVRSGSQPTAGRTTKTAATTQVDYTASVVRVEALIRAHGFGAVSAGQTWERGTGFCIGRGLVVTAAHIFKNSQEVTVEHNQASYPASIVLLDATRDIAVLQAGIDIPAAPLGNSDRVLPGDQLIIVGNPLGAEKVVTYGRLLCKDVYVNLSVPLLEINATLKVGNSGGPVFDASGKVIGMMVAQATDMNGNPIAGQAYAVPINAIKEALNLQ